MNRKLLVAMGILSSILGVFGCKNSKSSFIAKQITITQLDKELELCKAGKTEYDFIGIHSRGVDCIYFMQSKDKFNIDFEAMLETQIPYIEKLKEYAESKGFQYKMTTYGNQPHYWISQRSPCPSH